MTRGEWRRRRVHQKEFEERIQFLTVITFIAVSYSKEISFILIQTLLSYGIPFQSSWHTHIDKNVIKLNGLCLTWREWVKDAATVPSTVNAMTGGYRTEITLLFYHYITEFVTLFLGLFFLRTSSSVTTRKLHVTRKPWNSDLGLISVKEFSCWLYLFLFNVNWDLSLSLSLSQNPPPLLYMTSRVGNFRH
jgi:uncharacterized membrane protein YhaH (DUF805 family)